MSRPETSPAYKEILTLPRPGEWITSKELYLRAKDTPLQCGRMRLDSFRTAVYRAKKLGDLQSAILKDDVVSFVRYALPSEPLPEGAIGIPRHVIGRSIPQFVNLQRYGVTSPTRTGQKYREGYKVATRDEVLKILEDADHPMTTCEIASMGPFPHRSVQRRLQQAIKRYGVRTIKARGESVRYALTA